MRLCLKLSAAHDGEHDRADPVIIARGFAHDSAHGRHVLGFEAAPERVHHELLRQSRNKSSGRLKMASRKPPAPATAMPPGSVVVASIGCPASVSRQRPIGSKFSSASPAGSIIE